MGIMRATYFEGMFRLLLVAASLIALDTSVAQTATNSSFGVPWAATSVLHCKSGRQFHYFTPNTQSFQLFYRGKVRRLMFMPPGPTENWAGPRYSDIAYQSGNPFKLPTQGRGLEVSFSINKAMKFERISLYQISQLPNWRQYTLLDTCWR